MSEEGIMRRNSIARLTVVFEALALLPSAIRSLRLGTAIYMSGRSGTLLRALCIAAYDVLHKARYGQALDSQSRLALAALLELGAGANRLLDGKAETRDPQLTMKLRTAMRELRSRGHRSLVSSYLRHLIAQERLRPLPDGKHITAARIVAYREGVVRLSLGALATVASLTPDISTGIRATCDDSATNALFRIVMHCQIVDDVLDYRKDRAASLPTFLTAHDRTTFALSQTLKAVIAYGKTDAPIHSGATLLLRLGLVLLTGLTCTLVLLAWPALRTSDNKSGHGMSNGPLSLL
jgi:hypothetical protein